MVKLRDLGIGVHELIVWLQTECLKSVLIHQEMEALGLRMRLKISDVQIYWEEYIFWLNYFQDTYEESPWSDEDNDYISWVIEENLYQLLDTLEVAHEQI